MKDKFNKYVQFYKCIRVRLYVIKNNILDRLYQKFYTDQLTLYDMENEAMTEEERAARVERNLAWLDAQYVPEEIDEEHDVAKYSV